MRKTIFHERCEGEFLVSALAGIGLRAVHATTEHKIYIRGVYSAGCQFGELWQHSIDGAFLLLAVSHHIKTSSRQDATYHLHEIESDHWRILEYHVYPHLPVSSAGTLSGSPRFTYRETALSWASAIGIPIAETLGRTDITDAIFGSSAA